jgi:hypothetical protein
MIESLKYIIAEMSKTSHPTFQSNEEMTTPNEKLILVPVRVDAFIFTSQSYFPIQQAPSQVSDAVKEAESRAILAHITPPDYRSLRLENKFYPT